MKAKLTKRFETLIPSDYVTGIFCAVMVLLILSRAGALGAETAFTYAGYYFLTLMFVVLVVPLLDRSTHVLAQNPLTRFVRFLYPAIMLGIFFNWTEPVSHMFFSQPLDPYVLRLDEALFGQNLGKNLVHILGNNYWLSEFMALAYLSYYGTPWLVLYFYFRKSAKEFEYTAFVATLVMFTCFMLQSVIPVQGPIYNDPSIGGHIEAGPISAAAASFLADADVPGSAMPSGHVAGALTIMALTWIFYRKAFWVTAPMWISLSIATVYGHFHYVVDGVAGAFMALSFTFWLGPVLYLRFFPERLPDAIRVGRLAQPTRATVLSPSVEN